MHSKKQPSARVVDGEKDKKNSKARSQDFRSFLKQQREKSRDAATASSPADVPVTVALSGGVGAGTGAGKIHYQHSGLSDDNDALSSVLSAYAASASSYSLKFDPASYIQLTCGSQTATKDQSEAVFFVPQQICDFSDLIKGMIQIKGRILAGRVGVNSGRVEEQRRMRRVD